MTALWAARGAGRRVVGVVGHAVGRVTRRYYFEDYVRVYPDRRFNRLGVRRTPSASDEVVFRNHELFYRFAAQFVVGKRVIDAGCGSGYGTKLLKGAGATSLYAFDLSRHALRYARAHYGAYAEFSRQPITSLTGYPDGLADVVVCSEVLEHVKDYGREGAALDELVRVLAPGGVLVLGTPNSEMLADHGFSYDELSALVAARLSEFRIFENALVPSDSAARERWGERARAGRVGTIVSTELDPQAVYVAGDTVPEAKVGLAPGPLEIGSYVVDTRLLHSTHSWVVVAVKSLALLPRRS